MFSGVNFGDLDNDDARGDIRPAGGLGAPGGQGSFTKVETRSAFGGGGGVASQSQHIRPCTVYHLVKHSVGDNMRSYLDDEELAKVCVCGLLIGAYPQPLQSRLDLLIDDCSGTCITARYWIPCDGDTPEDDPSACELQNVFPDTEVGITYVSVTGAFSASPMGGEPPHVNADIVRAVSGLSEYFYHQLKAAEYLLRLFHQENPATVPTRSAVDLPPRNPARIAQAGQPQPGRPVVMRQGSYLGNDHSSADVGQRAPGFPAVQPRGSSGRPPQRPQSGGPVRQGTNPELVDGVREVFQHRGRVTIQHLHQSLLSRGFSRLDEMGVRNACRELEEQGEVFGDETQNEWTSVHYDGVGESYQNPPVQKLARPTMRGGRGGTVRPTRPWAGSAQSHYV